MSAIAIEEKQGKTMPVWKLVARVIWFKRGFFTFNLIFMLVLMLAACAPDRFRATDITGADFARTLQLTGHDGKPRTLADFVGKVVVVFFGYTQCPDVCPTTLSRFAEVAKELGPDPDRVQVLFVTVDPERDTQQVLAQYVPAFDPRFIGLYGDAAATARTPKEFKVLFQKQAGKTEQSFTVDHSAGTFIYDRAGRVRLFVRHEMPVEAWCTTCGSCSRSSAGRAGAP